MPSLGNYVRFRVSPEVEIAIGARAKSPGEGMKGEPVELSVVQLPEQGTEGRMDAYERLLGDAIAGDATLFARQDVVEAAWAIVDPVIRDGGRLHEYDPGDLGSHGGRGAGQGRGWLECSAGARLKITGG